MVENPLTAIALKKKIGVVDDIGNAKSLKDFQQSVQVSQVCDVTGKVVDILNRRIGFSHLDIEHIARELNLSKRTLQRRLQRSGSSFVELRDKVRFKHAMTCLLEEQMSIESTASYLNFSDRTSFTNAFKHWSGYSPSSFRKVYGGNKT